MLSNEKAVRPGQFSEQKFLTAFRFPIQLASSFGRRTLSRLNTTQNQNIRMKSKVALLALGMISSASAATLSIVADNDFAIFAGNATTVTTLVHQNTGGLYSQTMTNGSSITYNFAVGEDRFYVVAMGGGLDDNISGEVNLGAGTVNIASYFQSRADVTSFISGYNPSNASNGSQNVLLTEMQTALSSALTWSATIVEAAPNGTNGFWPPKPPGYLSLVHDSWDGVAGGPNSGKALLYFTPVPEPSSALLGGLGLLGLAVRRRRL
jgi:PEP-CTERM motif